jgi:hypothetical protein
VHHRAVRPHRAGQLHPRRDALRGADDRRLRDGNGPAADHAHRHPGPGPWWSAARPALRHPVDRPRGRRPADPGRPVPHLLLVVRPGLGHRCEGRGRRRAERLVPAAGRRCGAVVERPRRRTAGPGPRRRRGGRHRTGDRPSAAGPSAAARAAGSGQRGQCRSRRAGRPGR